MPATAFCASLSTSVATCTGCTNSVTRNRKPTSRPVVIWPSTPSSTPTTTTAPLAKAAVSSPAEKVTAAMVCASDLRGLGPVDRGVDALGRARLDAVRADHRRAHDGLGDRAEHLADPLAHQPVRRLQPLLEVPHASNSGRKQT